jgi:hypothetical protein
LRRRNVSRGDAGSLTYGRPIVSSADAGGAGACIAIKDLARGSVENRGKPMLCATSALASSSV